VVGTKLQAYFLVVIAAIIWIAQPPWFTKDALLICMTMYICTSAILMAIAAHKE
jgi:hypothetical protein